jgi:competence ComEA-like helix-hairpin-helix protein
VTLYSRHQLVLLIGLVVVGGVGLGIGEWRRANPELTATIEAIDHRPDDDRPASAAQPLPGRAAPSATAAPAAVRNASARPPKPDGPALPIDLNRASAADLTRLPGIGPVLAARIVAARDAHGPFASVDDLRRVSGLGSAKLSSFRELVTVSP